MSILSTSPTNTRAFDAEIAAALGDVNAAIILQQLNYWLSKERVGVIIDGTKFIYNTFVEWVNQQFPWRERQSLSCRTSCEQARMRPVWQFRKAMGLLRSLGIVKVIRHKAKEWNQTNYYSSDCDRLVKFLNSVKATTTETVELCVTSPQAAEKRSLEISDNEVSYIETEITTKERTTKQSQRDRQVKTLDNIAAASFKLVSEEKKRPENGNFPTSHFSAAEKQTNDDLSSSPQNDRQDESVVGIDEIINCSCKESISDLDAVGIPINKTLRSLLKLHPKEKVDSAIALYRTRKREQHIPNPAGYFTSALKEDWANQSLVYTEDGEIDTASVFRHWYNLARELGYCSGQNIRDGEQWICLSGSWGSPSK